MRTSFLVDMRIGPIKPTVWVRSPPSWLAQNGKSLTFLQEVPLARDFAHHSFGYWFQAFHFFNLYLRFLSGAPTAVLQPAGDEVGRLKWWVVVAKD